MWHSHCSVERQANRRTLPLLRQQNCANVYLNVLRERVEDLFCDLDGFGEVPLPLLVDDVFPGVVPVEVTDGLLWKRGAG